MADSFDGASALTFHDQQLDLVEHADGATWLRGSQVASALGYSDARRGVAELYDRNAAEFTDSMTALVKLPTAGGAQEVRIFSLRGAHLLGMFARTERAAEFRRWVLDVLEKQQPATERYPATVMAAVQRLMLQSEALRRNLLELNPKFRQVVRLHNITELTQAEKARLMGLKTADGWRQLLHEATQMGLVDYQPNPGRVAAGRAAIHHAQAKRTPPEVSPEHMANMRAVRTARAAKKGDQS